MSRQWIGLVFGVACAIVALLSWMGQSSALAQSPAQLRVLRSDAERVTLELDVPSYDTRNQNVNGTTYVALAIPGLTDAGAAGQPQLPVKGALVAIPSDAHATLRILSDESRRETLSHLPLPVPTLELESDPAQSLPQEVGRSFVPDAAVYFGNQLFPLEPVRVSPVSNWRSQRTLTVEFHPLQYDPVARQLIFHRRLRVEIAFERDGEPLDDADRSARNTAGQVGQPSTPVDQGAFEGILENALVNYDSAKAWRTPDSAFASQSVGFSSLASIASYPWYKIAISEDGIYTITCAQLENAGINLDSVDPRTLKIYKAGSELAINVMGQDDGVCDPGDYAEFYAQVVHTLYTDTNVYWLAFGGAPGKRSAWRDGGGTGSLATIFTSTVHLEQDRWYYTNLPWADNADHWFWNYLPDSLDRDGNGDPNSVVYALPSEHFAAGDFTATLQANLFGYNATGNHHTLVFINNHLIDDTIWSGRGERRATIPFPQAYLDAITNTVRVSETYASGNYILVNSFDFSYVGVFSATNNTRRFRQSTPGAWQYQIADFTTPDVEAFDITDPYSVTRIVSATITPAGSTYQLQFADVITTPHEYLALTPAQRKTPLSIAPDSPSNLHSTSNGADYIIISYGGFITNVQPLAGYRASQGLRVQVVDVQDVYDEFSDGLMNPWAIREFLLYAYGNWQRPAPAFVLLVGDGNWDYKNRYGTGDLNYISPLLRFVDPWIGETVSDNQLVAFDFPTTTLPYMAIGRLPADSAADVDAMVAKILNYEQQPPVGDWRNEISFVADNAYQADGTADDAGNFWRLSDSIASDPRYLPAPLVADRIYYNPCVTCTLPYPSYATGAATTAAITTAINSGRLIVNYIGHSSRTDWASNPQLFRLSDVNALANGDKLPMMLDMTCWDGYFIQPGGPSLAEVNVRLPGRGALASWSASGLGVAAGHDYLDQGFFDAVMQHEVFQIGLATVFGKLNLYTNSGGAHLDLIDTFNLLGDPASRLAVAPDVSIAKTVSPEGPRLIGTPITFTLVFSNAGVLPARDVVISDLLADTLLTPTVSFSGSAPLTPTGSAFLGWMAGTLNSGEGGIITITATLDPLGAHWWSTVLTNTAIITTSSQQNDTSNDQSTTSTPIAFPAPDVAIVKTVSPGGATFIGEPITYTLAFTNIGQFTADNVTISDLLPATLLAPAFTASRPVTPTGSAPFVWNVDNLDQGEGGVITVTARLDPVYAHWSGAALTNTASISTLSPQSDTTNDQSVTVTPVRFPVYLPLVFRQ